MFCASQRVQRRKAELTLEQIREKLPNGWVDWHQSWHTCANSYGNGYTPNKLPLETQLIKGCTWGVLGGQQLNSLGKLSDWHRLWFTFAASSGNGHRLNTGGISGKGGCVTDSKLWGSCQTAGPIGNIFGTHLEIRLRMEIRQPNCHSRHKGHWGGGVRGSNIQKSWDAVKRLDRLALNLVHDG